MARTTHTSDRSREALRTAAMVVGATFLLVGIAGFIPGVTQHYDTLEAAGRESEAKLLGLFQVSMLHNIVHLAFGVIGLLAARTASAAKSYLLVGGGVYLALWLYGMAIDLESEANFVPFNNADNWLHLGLGVAMIGLGLLLSRDDVNRGHRATPRTS